jgi:hypothetical protein
MIFVCGQVNPNPCRNCLLRNGPFAKCVVSPPHVLAISTIRHACANCTYQNQYRKCTNEPITEEEMARRLFAKGSTTSRAEPPLPRKPKAQAGAKAQTGAQGGRDSQKHQAYPQLKAPSLPWSQARLQEQDEEQEQQQQRRRHNPYRHIIRNPSSRSITVESFVDKLRHARAWSPRSRQKVKAEIMQWQAAIATAEAESKDPVLASGSGSAKSRSIPQSASGRVSKSSRSTRPVLPPPVSMVEGIPERDDDDDESDMSEDEGDTWVGLEGEVTMA